MQHAWPRHTLSFPVSAAPPRPGGRTARALRTALPAEPGPRRRPWRWRWLPVHLVEKSGGLSRPGALILASRTSRLLRVTFARRQACAMTVTQGGRAGSGGSGPAQGGRESQHRPPDQLPALHPALSSFPGPDLGAGPSEPVFSRGAPLGPEGALPRESCKRHGGETESRAGGGLTSRGRAAAA